MKQLVAYSYGQKIGTLSQSDAGSLSFQYLSGVSDTLQLSVAMPVREAPYSAKVTRAFIEGLVPEGYGAREALGREFGVSPRNPFALLEHIGADCAGAVQFFDPESEDPSLNLTGDLISCDEETIANRLRVWQILGRHGFFLGSGGPWQVHRVNLRCDRRTVTGLKLEVQNQQPISLSRVFIP